MNKEVWLESSTKVTTLGIITNSDVKAIFNREFHKMQMNPFGSD